MDKYCLVKTRVANLYKKPSFTSELITQALIDEHMLILEKNDNWYRVKQWDNYESFIYYKFVVDQDIYIDNNFYRNLK